MPFYYVESSALVKLYVREPGTDRMLGLAETCGPGRMTVLALTRVEFRSAVRRRQRCGDMDMDESQTMLARFDRHWAERFVIQPVTEIILAEAALLIDKHPLRAYDAVQLAGCNVLRSRMEPENCLFVCADQDLLAAAAHEGLTVLDPTR